MTDDATPEPPAKRPRGRPRAAAIGETVVRIMLPAELAERADRAGGVGQVALTQLIMRLLDVSEREDRGSQG